MEPGLRTRREGSAVAQDPRQAGERAARCADRMGLPVRYALRVSLRTDEQSIDLYAPIANQLRIPVPTEITAG